MDKTKVIVEKDVDFRSFEMSVIGGENHEKIVTIRCFAPFKCLINGELVIGFPGSIIKFSV